MKLDIKTLIVGIIIGIIASGITVYAVNVSSNNVEYDNTNSGLQSNNVEGAINELYKGASEKLAMNTFGESLIAQTQTYQHTTSVSLNLTKGKYLLLLSYGVGSHGPKAANSTTRISPQISCSSNNCVQSVLSGFSSYSYGAAAYKTSNGYLFNNINSALLYVDVIDENDTIIFNYNPGTNNYCSLVLTLQAIPVNS